MHNKCTDVPYVKKKNAVRSVRAFAEDRLCMSYLKERDKVTPPSGVS